MYSSVFEISHTPIPTTEWARAGNLPDWFYEQICDYAENPDPIQRQEDIDQLYKQLDGLCALDGDKFTVSTQIRERYFRKNYDHFKKAALALAQTDYEVFSGGHINSALSLVLDSLNSSYEDKRGVYIYLSEYRELVTLDCWIRSADFSLPFYIGGIIKYHY